MLIKIKIHGRGRKRFLAITDLLHRLPYWPSKKVDECESELNYTFEGKTPVEIFENLLTLDILQEFLQETIEYESTCKIISSLLFQLMS